MSLQSTDNNYVLRIENEFDSNTLEHSLGYFSSSLIAIKITSSVALSDWKKGGKIAQVVSVGDNRALVQIKDIEINKLNLFEFIPIQEGLDYELVYLALPRLVNVNIQVWEYQGQTVESLLVNLGNYLESSVNLQVDLSSVLDKLDNLNLTVDMSEVEAKLSDILDEMTKPQILLRILGLTGNQSKTINLWEQSNITTAIKIESIYIDSPAEDRIRIEILTSDNFKLTERYFNKSETPYDFPDLVLSRFLKVKVTSENNSIIDRVFIYCSQVAEPLIVDF